MSYNRQYPFTESKFERWSEEGRGTGIGAAYKPWLTEADLPAKRGHKDRSFSSIGNCRRITFSLTETRMLRHYEYIRGVTDAKTQFPLDREATRRIARELGIEHPRCRESQVDIVMTTDLVIDYQPAQGPALVLPRSAKESTALDDFNQAEHGEIERRYWLEQGHVWKLVTNSERCMPAMMVKNLELIRRWRFPPDRQPFEGHFEILCERLITAVVNYRGNQTLSEFGTQCQAEFGLSAGEAHGALLHLIFRHRLRGQIASSPLMDQRVATIAAETIERAAAVTRRSA